MKTISPAFLGFLRGLGMFVLIAVLSYIGSADHLSFLNPTVASAIAGVALWVEHSLSPSGTAVFGSVRVG